jgi:hypothetical protein
MTGCQCKSGFFALRDCGQQAVTQCLSCQRMVCLEHAARESNLTQCMDCWARANQGGSRSAYDDQWAYGYRHNYYSSGYAPLYYGSHHHHYYDQYDTRSFDQGNDGDFSDGDPRAGFGDS